MIYYSTYIFLFVIFSGCVSGGFDGTLEKSNCQVLDPAIKAGREGKKMFLENCPRDTERSQGSIEDIPESTEKAESLVEYCISTSRTLPMIEGGVITLQYFLRTEDRSKNLTVLLEDGMNLSHAVHMDLEVEPETSIATVVIPINMTAKIRILGKAKKVDTLKINELAYSPSSDHSPTCRTRALNDHNLFSLESTIPDTISLRNTTEVITTAESFWNVITISGISVAIAIGLFAISLGAYELGRRRGRKQTMAQLAAKSLSSRLDAAGRAGSIYQGSTLPRATLTKAGASDGFVRSESFYF